MLDSLDRLDRFHRKLDRLLGAEPERQQGRLAWSQATVLTEYADYPAEFFRDVLLTDLWSKQYEIALSVLKERRTAVRSGHKIGKSKLAAGLGCWWTCTRGAARGMLTAPTSRQVKKAVWYEVRRYWQECPDLRRLMPEPALAPETGCRWHDGRELFGFTASNADNVSGPGGPEVLVVIDEGPGVPREVWEALQGIRAGGGKVLALGNPTQTSGWFFDAFNERRKGWAHFNVSSTDTPNFLAGHAVIPGLADRDFVQEVIDDYGEDSPQYAVRVKGDFPANVSNAVIGLGLIEGGRVRWEDDEVSDKCDAVDIGVDVARFGDDDSAVSGRRGLRLYTPAWFEREPDEDRRFKAVVNGYDSVKVAGLALAALRALRKPGERARIKVDVTGGFGEPVCAMLRALRDTGEIDDDVQVIPVNFAGESSDPDIFPVIRDELWFGGRYFFRAGGAIYRDPKCESELIAPTYEPDLKGRNKVEKKRDTKKRLGRSPDRADSALLAIYQPNATIEAPDDDVSEYQDTSRWEGVDGRGYG
jgi:phage terminase large subunit